MKEVKHAMVLNGKIARKAVNQTIMTTVYRVTFIGARDRIEGQFRERKDIPDEECWYAALYLTKKVIGSIGDLFSGTQDIQTWLNFCARLISKSTPPARIAATLFPLRPGGVILRRLPRWIGPGVTAVVRTTPLGFL